MKLEQMVNEGTKDAVVQNLWDAGCTQEMIACFMAHLDGEEMEELLALLEQHRSCLLDKVHEKERQIDCLDYLVYQIKRKKRQDKTESGFQERGRKI